MLGAFGKVIYNSTMNNVDQINAEIHKNFKFNFTVNLLDVASFMFGDSFISSSGVLLIYVTHFTQNPLLISLIAVLSTAGFLVPQLFTANIVERAPVKKYFPFNLGFFLERIPVFLLAPSTILLATRSSRLALIVFFILYAWRNFGAGMLMVGWQDMIAKIIPVHNRGKFFGLSNFLGNFSGILGATAVSWLLTKNEFPRGFVITFIFASVFILLSWIFLGLTREPPVPTTKPTVSHRDYFKALPQTLRANPNFQRYLMTQIVSAFGAMASGFLLVYVIERWSISDGTAATYTITLLIGQSVANLFLGFLADRKGHKIVLEISILSNISCFLLALLAPTPIWFYAVFTLRGMMFAGNFISGLSLPLEFSEPQDRPTFIGLASTLPGLAGTIAPLLAGLLASLIGYPLLFAITTGIAMIAFGMMKWLVRDPRHLAV
jgi:MFS family permease